MFSRSSGGSRTAFSRSKVRCPAPGWMRLRKMWSRTWEGVTGEDSFLVARLVFRGGLQKEMNGSDAEAL